MNSHHRGVPATRSKNSSSHRQITKASSTNIPTVSHSKPHSFTPSTTLLPSVAGNAVKTASDLGSGGDARRTDINENKSNVPTMHRSDSQHHLVGGRIKASNAQSLVDNLQHSLSFSSLPNGAWNIDIAGRNAENILGAEWDNDIDSPGGVNKSNKIAPRGLLTAVRKYCLFKNIEHIREFAYNLLECFDFENEEDVDVNVLQERYEKIAKDYFAKNPDYKDNGDMRYFLKQIAALATVWQKGDYAFKNVEAVKLLIRKIYTLASSEDNKDDMMVKIEQAFIAIATQLQNQVIVIYKQINKEAKISSNPPQMTSEVSEALASVFCDTIDPNLLYRVTLRTPSSSHDKQENKTNSNSGMIGSRLNFDAVANDNIDDDKQVEQRKNEAKKFVEGKITPLKTLCQGLLNNQLISKGDEVEKNISLLLSEVEQLAEAEIKAGKSEYDLRSAQNKLASYFTCVTDTYNLLDKVLFRRGNAENTVAVKQKTISNYYNKYTIQAASGDNKVAKFAICLLAGIAGLIAGALLGATAGAYFGFVTGGFAAVPGTAWGLLVGFQATYASAAYLLSSIVFGAAFTGIAAWAQSKPPIEVNKSALFVSKKINNGLLSLVNGVDEFNAGEGKPSNRNAALPG